MSDHGSLAKVLVGGFDGLDVAADDHLITDSEGRFRFAAEMTPERRILAAKPLDKLVAILNQHHSRVSGERHNGLAVNIGDDIPTIPLVDGFLESFDCRDGAADLNLV